MHLTSKPMFGSWNCLLLDTNQSRDAALASPGNVLSPVLVWMDCGKYHTGHTGIPEDRFLVAIDWLWVDGWDLPQKLHKCRKKILESGFNEVMQNCIKAVHTNCHQRATSLIGYHINRECRHMAVHHETVSFQFLRLQILESFLMILLL